MRIGVALLLIMMACPAMAGPGGVTITRNPDGSVTIEGGKRTPPPKADAAPAQNNSDVSGYVDSVLQQQARQEAAASRDAAYRIEQDKRSAIAKRESDEAAARNLQERADRASRVTSYGYSSSPSAGDLRREADAARVKLLREPAP